MQLVENGVVAICCVCCNTKDICFVFEDLPPLSWEKVFSNVSYEDNPMPEEAINLLEQFLRYNPKTRITPFKALADPFFDEIHAEEVPLPNEKPLPPLFNFTEDEHK